MVTVREDVTLEVVLRYLRRFEELPDHTDQLFVAGSGRAPEGRPAPGQACSSTTGNRGGGRHGHRVRAPEPDDQAEAARHSSATTG